MLTFQERSDFIGKKSQWERHRIPQCPAVLDWRLSGVLPAGAASCNFFRTQAWLCYHRGHSLHYPRLPAEGARLSLLAFLSLTKRIRVVLACLRHRILMSPTMPSRQHPQPVLRSESLSRSVSCSFFFFFFVCTTVQCALSQCALSHYTGSRTG